MGIGQGCWRPAPPASWRRALFRNRVDQCVSWRSSVTQAWPKTQNGRLDATRLQKCCFRRSARSSELLLDFALDDAGILRKLFALRLGEEGVEAAAMLDRAKRVGRNAQAHRALERVGEQRDVAEVRQELPLGLVVRVADGVATQHGLAGQFATARHGFNPIVKVASQLQKQRV